MANIDADEIGKQGNPPKVRRFPWRLWLYAIVMTAAAAGAGYKWWESRRESGAATEDASSCLTKLGKQEALVTDAAKKADDATRKADDAKKEVASCLASLDDKIKQLTTTSSNLDTSKDELTALRMQRAEAEKRLAAIDEIQRQFAKMIDTGQLKVTSRRGSLVLSLPSEVLFPSGVAELSKPGELAVLEVGITLKRFPDRRFLVVGHTDDVPLKNSTYKDNWELSTARALTVTRFLVQAGMDPRNLVAAGAGEHDPVSKERAKNRRIEIALLPAIGELPPLPASLGADTAAKPDAPKTDAPKADAPKPDAAKPDAAKPAPKSP